MFLVTMSPTKVTLRLSKAHTHTHRKTGREEETKEGEFFAWAKFYFPEGELAVGGREGRPFLMESHPCPLICPGTQTVETQEKWRHPTNKTNATLMTLASSLGLRSSCCVTPKGVTAPLWASQEWEDLCPWRGVCMFSVTSHVQRASSGLLPSVPGPLMASTLGARMNPKKELVGSEQRLPEPGP